MPLDEHSNPDHAGDEELDKVYIGGAPFSKDALGTEEVHFKVHDGNEEVKVRQIRMPSELEASDQSSHLKEDHDGSEGVIV